MMEWLIDGYNLLAGNGLGGDERSRRWLRQRLQDHFARKQVEVRVVYDHRGAEFAREYKVSGNFTEVYAPQADPYIVEKAERSLRPRSLVVVSDDWKDIGSKIRRLGARLVGSKEFLALISPPPQPTTRPEKPEEESAQNIERYRRLWAKWSPTDKPTSP